MRKRISIIGLTVLALALSAMPAFATADSAGVTAVKGVLDNAETDATQVALYGLGIALTVAVLFVAFKLGKRVMNKI